MTANLKRGLHTDAIIGNLKVVLRLLSNMAQADNSTGKVRSSCLAVTLYINIALYPLVMQHGRFPHLATPV